MMRREKNTTAHPERELKFHSEFRGKSNASLQLLRLALSHGALFIGLFAVTRVTVGTLSHSRILPSLPQQTMIQTKSSDHSSIAKLEEIRHVETGVIGMSTNNRSRITTVPSSAPTLALRKTQSAAGTHPDAAIFYNVFVDPKEQSNGIRIIKEQTQQMYQILKEQNRAIPPLYYNLIGYNYTERFCPLGMTCNLRKFYQKAFEEVTLNDLHSYCQDNPNHVVYYMHNKGSFNPYKNKGHDDWRRNLTEFAFRHSNRLFTNYTNGRRRCNAVGLTWEPFPWWHFPGNMWAANCSYVRQLLPPKDFEIARSRLFHSFFYDFKSPKSPYYCLSSFIRSVFSERQPWEVLSMVGIDRYNYEGWISSHPDIAPCDSADAVIKSRLLDFDFSSHRKYQGQKHHGWKYEWWRKQGRLFEFNYLYNTIPPNSSFFWTFYAGTDGSLEPKMCRNVTTKLKL